MFATMPYELWDRLKPRAGTALPPGQWRGACAGVVLTCLFFLAAYNIQLAASSKAQKSASSTRLATFDIVRFVLESCVLHVHLGGRGLYPGAHSMYLTAYRMPAFVFVTGIFGSSMAYESLSKLLCATLGTTAIVIVLRQVFHYFISGDPDTVWNQFLHGDLSEQAGDYWFLTMLAFCRIFVTPVFYAAKTHLGMRPLVPFLLTKLVSYFLMHKVGRWGGWIFGMYNWHSALAFMPYFALGLLLTPTEWDTLLRRRRVQLVCVGYFVLWYLLQMVPTILQWNSSFCLPLLQTHGCRAHFDIRQIIDPITPSLFALDIIFFALRVGITLSATCLVIIASEIVGYIWPYLNELMAGWGSRTLYAYTLQQFCLDLLGKAKLFSHKPPGIRGSGIVLEFTIPVFVNIVFSSKGTESLFRWILLPYWLKDFGENPHIIDYPRWLERKAQLTAGATKLAESATSACGKAKASITSAAASAWARAKAKLAPGEPVDLM